MLGQIRERKFQSFAAQPVRGLGDHLSHSRLRRLPQDSGRLAILVAVDLSPLGIAASQGDAPQLQSASVGDCDVAIDPHQKHGVSARYFIQIPARGRHSYRPKSFIPP